MDVARNDSNLRLADRCRTRTVGTDQPSTRLLNLGDDLEHVKGRDVLGNAEDGADAGVERFQDGVGGTGRWNVDDARVGARFFDRCAAGVEHGDGLGKGRLTALSRGSTTDD